MIQKTMKIDKIIAVEVNHCPQSYACLLVAKEGFGKGGKIIYSGDTTPCTNFINYAQGCSLMIHEATLAAGMEADAKNKGHTTTAQAMELIKEIKPWRAVLTHFSCRYMKVAEILPEHKENKVMVAFDHMRMNLSDFEWAYRFLDIFEKVISNEKEDDDEADNADEEVKQMQGKHQNKRQKLNDDKN